MAVMQMTATAKPKAAQVVMIVHHQMTAVQQTVAVIAVALTQVMVQVMVQVMRAAPAAAVAILHRNLTHQIRRQEKVSLRNQGARNREKNINSSCMFVIDMLSYLFIYYFLWT